MIFFFLFFFYVIVAIDQIQDLWKPCNVEIYSIFSRHDSRWPLEPNFTDYPSPDNFRFQPTDLYKNKLNKKLPGTLPEQKHVNNRQN